MNVGALDVRRTPDVKVGLWREWSFDVKGEICLPPSIYLSLLLSLSLLSLILTIAAYVLWCMFPSYSDPCTLSMCT